MSHYCVAARREAQPLFLGGTPPFAPHDGLSPMKVDHLRWAGFVGELVLHAVGLHPFILYAAAVAFWQLGNWTAFTE